MIEPQDKSTDVWPPPPGGPSTGSGAKPGLSANVRLMWLAALSYFAFNLLIGNLDYAKLHQYAEPLIPLFAFGPTFGFMLLQLWLPLACVRVDRTPVQEIAAAAGFGVAWLASMLPMLIHARMSLGVVAIDYAAGGVLETIGFAIIGAFAARIVREAKLLLPIGFIAGLIDIIGAMTPIGFTAHFVAKQPSIINHVSIHVPVVTGVSVPATIGPGDAFFIAFFLAAIHRHAMNERRTFWMFYVLLTISLLSVQFSHVIAIGALAPMGIAVIFSNMPYFDFNREEKFAMLYAGGLALLLTMGFFLYTNSLFHRRHSTHGAALVAPRATRMAYGSAIYTDLLGELT